VAFLKEVLILPAKITVSSKVAVPKIILAVVDSGLGRDSS
jgi:hypothetical protein